MSVEVGRRVFVGSVVTGLPLLVRGSGIALGAATLTAGVSLNAQGQRRSVENGDPLIQEIQRLARQGAGKMRTRPGEGTRQVAAALRLRAAHGKGQNLDAQVAQALRRAIRTHGRQALLQAQPDPDAFRAEMSAAGFPNAVLPTVDVAEREKLLNALLSPAGYTGVLTTLATQLDAQADQLDRSVGTMVPASGDGPAIAVRRVQSEASYYCPILRNQLQHLNFLQIVWCSPLLIWAQAVIFMAECAFLAGALGSTYAQLYFWGCPA
jgi:hypothetical protein